MHSLVHPQRSPPQSVPFWAASSRPTCLGGWDSGSKALIILVVLTQIRLVKDVPYTGPRQIDVVGALLSIVDMGGLVLGILVWQEGGQFVGLLMGIGAATLAAFAYWLGYRKRRGKPTLLDPDLFRHLNFRIGISQQMLQQVTLGGAMIVLPLFLQMTLEYNAMRAGLSLAPLSLSMFGVAMFAGRKAGKWRPANVVLVSSSSVARHLVWRPAETQAIQAGSFGMRLAMPACDRRRSRNSLRPRCAHRRETDVRVLVGEYTSAATFAISRKCGPVHW